MGKAGSARLRGSRPTIGLFIGRLGEQRYQAHVWPGVADAARARDVNLVCFVGGPLRSPEEFDAQRNVIYDLAGPENVDGLLVMSGSLGQFIGAEQLAQFYERYRPLPIISIALALDGIPGVLVDNESGMRQALVHLIQVHRLRRIAFIRGPETNTEAEQRYRAYIGVLAEHDIPFDPNLVVCGDFLASSGAEAVRLLLDERKADFEALVAANDEMALGALEALQERGMRVPDDVSIIGFDDIEEARFATPPLSTVRQPLYEQGRRAAEMLLALLAGEDVPEQVTLPTELVVRRSCGCLLQPVEKMLWKPGTLKPSLRRKRILSEMVEAAGVSSLPPEWAEQLLDAFSAALEHRSPEAFLAPLDAILRQVGARGHDVMHWQQVLAVLRYALPPSADGETLAWCEALWQQARELVGDIAQWAQASRRIRAERQAFDFTTRISEPLMTTFDVAGLSDVIAQQLPQIGIEGCYLALYEPSAEDGGGVPPQWSRLILAYNEKGRIPLEPEGRRFPSRQLVPDGIMPQDRRYAIMLEPLHFRDEMQLGFIIFEPLQTRAGVLREMLGRLISVVLRGALLLQERQRMEEALQKSEQQYRLLFEFNKEMLEHAPVGVMRLDSQMRIQYENPELQRIIGLPPGEERSRAIGMDIRELPGIQEAGIANAFDDLLQGKVILAEFPFTSIYGKETFLRAVGSPIWENGEFVGSVLLVEDITERKRMEEALQASQLAERQFQERLRSLLEVGNELSKADSVDALWRQAVELGRERLGFDRLGIWLRSPDPGFVVGTWRIDENGNVRDERAVRSAVSGGQREILSQKRPVTLRQEDEDLLDGDGNVVGRGPQAQAAIWDGEQTIGLIAVDNLLTHRPITDYDCELLNLYASTLGHLCLRKRTEEALREYSERLEEMVEERTRELREAQEQLIRREKLAILGQLAGGVGHELRNPLGVISNAVYFLQMTLSGADETTREYLGIISSEVRNAEKIVSDLLGFSRIRAAEKEEIAVSDLIARTLERQPPPENVAVATVIDADVPPVFVDSQQIVQVLINLVTNAYQAMPEGGRLTIGAQVRGDRVALAVTDTGCGIPQENMGRLFEPLFTTRARGIGLGLVTSKNLVEANGGSIEVQSEVGKGSTFTIVLPIGRKEAQ